MKQTCSQCGCEFSEDDLRIYFGGQLNETDGLYWCYCCLWPDAAEEYEQFLLHGINEVVI